MKKQLLIITLIFVSLSLFAQNSEEKGITKEIEKISLEQLPKSRIDIRNDNLPINLSKKASCGVYERLIDAKKFTTDIRAAVNDENLQIRGSKNSSNGVIEFLGNNPEHNDEFSALATKGMPMGVREWLTPDSDRALGNEENVDLNVEKEVNIFGKIQNQAGEPLIGAHIIAYDKDRLVGATVSSIYGDFELTSKANTEIEVSYLGYQPIRESVQYFLDKPVIVLTEGVDLPEVVVTAYNSGYREGCVLRGWGHGPSDVILKDSINLSIAFTPTIWQVYPNPTADKITIKTVFTKGIFKLISPQGQVLKMISIQDQNTEIDLHEYPAGNYYLRYESDSWAETFGPVLKIGN